MDTISIQLLAPFAAFSLKIIFVQLENLHGHYLVGIKFLNTKIFLSTARTRAYEVDVVHALHAHTHKPRSRRINGRYDDSSKNRGNKSYR